METNGKLNKEQMYILDDLSQILEHDEDVCEGVYSVFSRLAGLWLGEEARLDIIKGIDATDGCFYWKKGCCDLFGKKWLS